MTAFQPSRLIAGTRTSRLAMWQTNHVVERLQAAWPGLACEIAPFLTAGDRSLDRPLPEVGGKGLFTAELEDALRDGRIDFAVHSLKDLPVDDAPGLILGAITSRADVRDGLVARNGGMLATLPPGSVVGTSSIRRQAQLLAVRPDLDVRPIRGNVETRVRKVLRGDYDAAVLAAAGLQRLELEDVVTEWLPLDLMLPAPGQAALAVQCRAADERTLALLALIDDQNVRRAVTAERAFLDALGGGCSAPVAAFAELVSGGLEPAIQLRGLVAWPDGRRIIRVAGRGADPTALGVRLAGEALAAGAAEMVAEPPPTGGDKPLHGRRIVVTRAAHQAGPLSAALARAGAVPVVIPAIAIAPMDDLGPLDRAIAELDRYDWLLFTSANGVDVFFDRLALLGREPAALDGLRVAAVGAATAEALGGRGARVDFVPGEYVGEALAAGLGDLRGRRVLLPRAEIGRRNLAEMLAGQGAVVDDIPTYRTVPAELSATALDELAAGVDAITFASPSAVRNLVAALEAIGRPAELLGDAAIACIGPVTAEAARNLGLSVALVPETYTSAGLVEALAGFFACKETIR